MICHKAAIEGHRTSTQHSVVLELGAQELWPDGGFNSIGLKTLVTT